VALWFVGQRLWRTEEEEVLSTLRRVHRAFRLPKVDVSVAFVLDAEMQMLNKRHRSKNKTTDVLSFASDDGDAFPGAENVLGDLVISVDTARRQARAQGHSSATEAAVLYAHGMLHLWGLDHERGAAEAEFQLACELTVLAAAGVSPLAALSVRGLAR
jgi:rRNA maturation RNase YbeY